MIATYPPWKNLTIFAVKKEISKLIKKTSIMTESTTGVFFFLI